MTRFFKFLTVFVLVAMAGQAWSGWNLRQNSDGTADFVRPNLSSGEEVNAPVGRVILTTIFNDVSNAATQVLVSPITDARISLIQTVLFGQITGTDTVFDFWLVTGITSDGISATDEVTNGSSRMTTTACTTPQCDEGLGTVDSFTPLGAAAAHAVTHRDIISQGTAIFIHGNGGSTNGVSAAITITLDPR